MAPAAFRRPPRSRDTAAVLAISTLSAPVPARLRGFVLVRKSPNDLRLVPPTPGAVLVVERRDSWVRVLDPVSGASCWVDLEEMDYETVSGGDSATCASPSAGEAGPEPSRSPNAARLTRGGGTA